MSSGLKLLSLYDSENEEDSENEKYESSVVIDCPVKRKKLNNKLPLPPSLQSRKVEPEVYDDDKKHDGRKRSFPHERGNWSSLVFIPYNKTEAFNVFCDQIIDLCNPDLELKKISEPHISLSRTFVLYHHWIVDFHSALRHELTGMSSFKLTFDGVKVYCNEQLTRTFVAVSVGLGSAQTAHLVHSVDLCLKDYNLSTFYEEASFHMSVCWCLGNVKEELEGKLPAMMQLFEVWRDNPMLSFSCKSIIFKTGFKEYILRIC